MKKKLFLKLLLIFNLFALLSIPTATAITLNCNSSPEQVIFSNEQQTNVDFEEEKSNDSKSKLSNNTIYIIIGSISGMLLLVWIILFFIYYKSRVTYSDIEE